MLKNQSYLYEKGHLLPCLTIFLTYDMIKRSLYHRNNDNLHLFLLFLSKITNKKQNYKK